MIVNISSVNAHSIADACVDEWFESIKCDDQVYVATTCQLARLRVAHKRGYIHIEYIKASDGVRIYLDDMAKLSAWPDGMMDEASRLLAILAKR